MSVPILFYAPMKPPGTFPPSGDTHLAALLVEALTSVGFAPQLASRLATYDGIGNGVTFAVHEAAAKSEIARILAEPKAHTARLLFTYHCYHKAPDLIGPQISAALRIPYAIAEASRARKQAYGPWAQGFSAADHAFQAANVLFAMTPRDRIGLETMAGTAQIADLKPFIAHAPFAEAADARAAHRARWQQQLSIPDSTPILLAAAMMRPGKKAAGFADLAAIMRALAATTPNRAILVLAGSGAAENAVRTVLAPFAANVRFAGLVARTAMPSLYAAADLHVWPGRNEAFGLAYLEAAAAGTPNIAFDQAGVPAVVSDGITGRLVAPFDYGAFAATIAATLADRNAHALISQRGPRHVATHHSIAAASRQLRATLHPLIGLAP